MKIKTLKFVSALLLLSVALISLCAPSLEKVSASQLAQRETGARARAQATRPQASRAQASQTPAPSSFTPLTAQERRGKALYLRGESPTGREITALMGEIDVPGTTLTCAGCHGARGEGKTEGGVTAGSLTWAHLLKPYGHTHPNGRKHGAFNEASFVRAMTAGIDPAGNNLLVAMPRYRMSPADVADLISYLKRIETDRDPGLADESIRVGTLVPATGALGETGKVMRQVLNAYFAEVNARGGIYNRQVELRAAETGANAAATTANLQSLLANEQVFALVGGLIAGHDREVSDLVRREEVPLIGASTLLPPASTPPNRYAFYTLSGIREQARALFNFAARKDDLKRTRIGIVSQDGEISAQATAAVEEQARKLGAPPPFSRRAANASEAAQVVKAMKQEGVGVVFFFGTGATANSFLQEASAGNWSPTLLFIGALTSGEVAASVTPLFREKVFLSFPTIPSDITPTGQAEYASLKEKYKLPGAHLAAQLSALTAAKIFVEGLKLAGRDLTREKLVTALEGLYEFETHLTPRLTYGANRRVGAAGAYLVTIDPETKQFKLASEWVAAN